MKKITKNTLITSGVIALALIANPTHAGLNTFEETFKKELLKEIELQIKNDSTSDIELEEVAKEIDVLANSGDLKNTLINELKEEVNFFDTSELKNELINDIEKLIKIGEGDKFYDEINKVYDKLDTYYEENYDFENEYDQDIEGYFEDEYEFSFADNKSEVIQALNEEISYISYKNLQNEVSGMITILKTENNEDKFYDKLEDIYEKLDSYYAEHMSEEIGEDFDEEYDFTEDKNDTIRYLTEEVANIDKKELKIEITDLISELKIENDEDTYFEKIDTIYNKLDIYYEKSGIDFDEEYEFEDNENFDFEAEKIDMLNFLGEEIDSITDTLIKNELKVKLDELKNETNINNFYEKIDSLYEHLDDYFEDDENRGEYNFEENTHNVEK